MHTKLTIPERLKDLRVSEKENVITGTFRCDRHTMFHTWQL